MAYGNDFSSTQSADPAEKAAQREGVTQALNRLLQTNEQLRQQSNVNRDFALKHAQMAQAIEQRRFENSQELQKTADLGRRLDIQQNIGQGYLDLGKQQLDMQKSAGTPAYNANQRFYIQNAQNDAANGIFSADKYGDGKVPPEMIEPLQRQSDQAATQKNAYATRLQNWADTLNERNTIAARQDDLKKRGADQPGHWYSGGPATDAERTEFSNNAVKLANLLKITSDPLAEKQFAPYMSYDPKTGTWHSAVLPSAVGVPKPNPDSPLAPPAAENADAGAGGGLSLGDTPQSTDPNAPPTAPGTTTPNYFSLLGGGSTPAGVPGAPYQPIHPPAFYDRVNFLTSPAGGGLNPTDAVRQVTGEAMKAATSGQ